MIKPRLTTATRGRTKHVRLSRWSALSFVLLLALVPLAAAPVEAASRATPAPEVNERRSGVASQLGVTHVSTTMERSANDHASSKIASRAVAQAPVATTSFTGTSDVYKLETKFAGDRLIPNIVRSGHTTTLLSNGKVLVVGGVDNAYQPIDSVELYDPVTGIWTVTGSLNKARQYHTATLLANGKVLVVGGDGEDAASAELYDPNMGTFTLTGGMYRGRSSHTATPLANGKVLIVGGFDFGEYLVTAEVYDPATGRFTATGSMQQKRTEHTATLLGDDKVLVVGGRSTDIGYGGTMAHPLPDYASKAEVYDPASGTWTVTGGTFYNDAQRSGHTATLLPNGKVLIAGGEYIELWVYDAQPYEEYITLSSALLYDPTTGSFTSTGSMPEGLVNHTATLLPSGKVLIAGGAQFGWDYRTKVARPATSVYDPAIGDFTAEEPLLEPRSGHTATLLPTGEVLIVGGADEQAELLDYVYVTTFNGTLTLPSGWSTTSTPTVTFRGSTTRAPLTDGALNDGPWIAAQPNAEVTTTLPPIPDERAFPVLLRLRDAEGRVANVVLGHVNIDATLPRSQMHGLPATSRLPVTLQWGGDDATSGIESYDVEVRDGVYGTWTPLLSRTTAVSTSFTGEQRHTYFFRVRARDVAGNVEAWPETPDSKTQVDIVAPIGSLRINNGALATTSRTVTLALNARDAQSPVRRMRIAQTGTSAVWLPYATSWTLRLAGTVGVKQVTVQFQDSAGNISQPITQSIRLDRAGRTTAVFLPIVRR